MNIKFMQQNKPRQIIGFLLAFTCIFIWGITFVSTKYLLQSFSPLEILLFRFLAAYLALWILNPHSLKLNLKQEILFILAGLSGVTLYQFLENVAISFTTASNVSIIVSICPIFTAIFSQIFFKEKHLSLFFILGFFVAIFGVALVSFNGSIKLNISPKGDLLALGSAISWGFYSLCISKINSLGLNNLCTTRRIFFWALIFMFFITIFGQTFNVSRVDFSLQTNAIRFKNVLNILNILFLGWGASAFCFTAWNKACKMLGTVKASIGIYMIPVVTVIFAFFILDEKITIMGIIGTFLTILGLLLSNKK